MKSFFRNESIWMLVLSLGIPALGLLVGLIAPTALRHLQQIPRNASPPAETHRSVP